VGEKERIFRIGWREQRGDQDEDFESLEGIRVISALPAFFWRIFPLSPF
jgi:hypothetical protein